MEDSENIFLDHRIPTVPGCCTHALVQKREVKIFRMATKDPKRTELSISNSKPTCLEQHTVVHYKSKVKRKVSE